MKDREILEKAIEKVHGNNITGKFIDEWLLDNSYKSIIFSHEFAKAFWGEELTSDGQTEQEVLTELRKEINNNGIGVILSNKDIKEDFMYSYIFAVPKYQYHLQQMVLWTNPLYYLATFLKSDCCQADIKYTDNSGVYVCPGHYCSKCNKLL